MSTVFVIRNQEGYFASKQKEWVDGRDTKQLFRSPHKDEAINLVFELSSKDIYLRAEAITVEQDEKKQPIVEVTVEEVTEPSAQDGEPLAEDTEPSAQDREPSAEDREPSAEDREPSAEDVEPLTQEVAPSLEETKPSAESIESTAEKAANVVAFEPKQQQA